MTTTTERFPRRTELTRKLFEKRYRHEFVDSRIRRGLPLQIRAMREARGWNQKQLGEAAGIPQANISRVENTRDKFLAFQTLLKIAEALDVALVVKFAPFSELEEWATLPLADSVPPDFLSDSKQREAWEGEARAETEISEPATLDAYILKRYGRQVPETTYPLGIEPPAGGLDGTNRSSQIGGPDVRQAGKREPSRKVS